MYNVILISFSFIKYVRLKEECKVCVLYLVSFYCDVCGYCMLIDFDLFLEVFDKYSVLDLVFRIWGLFNYCFWRYIVG